MVLGASAVNMIEIFNGATVPKNGSITSVAIDISQYPHSASFALHYGISGAGTTTKIELLEGSSEREIFLTPNSVSDLVTGLSNASNTGNHGFIVGDSIIFEGIGGMTEIEGTVGLITAISANVSVTIGALDTSGGYTSFTSGGLVRAVNPKARIVGTITTTNNIKKVPNAVGVTGISEADPAVVLLVQGNDILTIAPPVSPFFKFKVTETGNVGTNTINMWLAVH